MVAAAQTTSNHNFDDSHLSRVKELVGDLRTRLDVEERLVGAEGYYAAEIPVSEPSTENIMEQISLHFATAAPATKANQQPVATVAKTR